MDDAEPGLYLYSNRKMLSDFKYLFNIVLYNTIINRKFTSESISLFDFD